MMQTHIKELMMNLAKAESDKQKIAEEAYRYVKHYMLNKIMQEKVKTIQSITNNY